MRVRVAFTVDVDIDSWQLQFGTSRDELRDDVKRYAERLAYEALDSQGLLK